MALQDINLVPETEVASQSKKNSRLLYVASAAVLAVFLTVLVIVFSLYALSVKSLHDIRSQEAPIQTNIQDLAKREYYVRAVSGKVGAIQNIQQTEAPFQQIVSRLIELQGSDVVYTTLTLTGPNTVLVSATAANIDAVDRYLADLTQKEFGRQVFSNILLQSLSRDTNGSYELTMHFVYTGGNK